MFGCGLLFVGRCLLLVVCCPFFMCLVVRCWLFVVRCLLFRGLFEFAVCGVLCVVHCVLFIIVRCLLPVVCCLYLFVLILLIVCRSLFFVV